MENDNQTQVAEALSKNKRKRGVFPRISLKKALELARAILAVGQGEPVRRVKVFDYLGKSAGSGPSRTLIIVSSMYGLTSGGFQAEHLELTDIGKKVATSGDLGLIYEILFKNEIFSKFIEYWKDKVLPEDDIVSDWLIRNFHLVPEDSRIFWEVIKENIKDYHLTEQLSGKPNVISKEVAMKSHGAEIVPSKNTTSIQETTTPKLLEPSISEEKAIAIQTADIDLENGGKAKIVVSSKEVITKGDVKKMKTQIDIFSNFIDSNK